jgi:hypothetical protein
MKNLLARGYLDGSVAREETDLVAAVDAISAALGGIHAPSLTWIHDVLVAVRLDDHQSPPRPPASIDEATRQVEQRISPMLPRESARQVVQAYRDLHTDGESLAFFLGRQEYAAVVVLYRQLHDRVVSLLRALSDAGLA